MNREIRIPKQKRSIEKKNKIVEAAYKVFNEKGYHNTNTAEIAKTAGLSTGCLYDYFLDKKDIFFDALKMHNETITNIIHDKLKSLPEDMILYDVIYNFIKIFMEAHNHSEGFHKEVMSLSYSDPEINNYIKSYESLNIIEDFSLYFEGKGINVTKEKLLLFLTTTDNICHELIFNSNESIDKEMCISECAHMLEYMLTRKL